MNNEQLESCLKKLKSSSREPDVIDELLEKRIMNEMKQRSSRTGVRRLAFKLSIFLVCFAGLLCVGAVVADNISVATSKLDPDGNVVVHSESLWKYLMYHVHEHLKDLHEHLRGHGW